MMVCKSQFAYDGNANVEIYHLMGDSWCINRGDPTTACADQNDIDGEKRWMGDYVDMGADEVCPDCNDVYNAYDWNADGQVDMDEYARFSRAWLTWDPYIQDPNFPNRDYYCNPSSPGYVNPNYFVGWDSQCNLDTTGTSQYTIDLADLKAFLSEDIPWLWWACWRVDIQDYLANLAHSETEGVAASSAAALSAESVALSAEAATLSDSEEEEVVATVASVSTFSATSTTSASVEEESVDVADLLEEIDALIGAGGDDAGLWAEMKTLLRQSLVESEDTADESAVY